MNLNVAWIHDVESVLKCPLSLALSLSSGLHHHYVFPAELAGQAASVRRDGAQPDPRQPRGRPAMATWHLFPERQEVLPARRDGQEPHDPAPPRRHGAVWAEVNIPHAFLISDHFTDIYTMEIFLKNWNLQYIS